MKNKKIIKQKEQEKESQIELKKQICNQLEGKRKFLFTWAENVGYSAVIEASTEEDAVKLWSNGEYDADIDECEYLDDSLDIMETIE